jgi:hypothetical protein
MGVDLEKFAFLCHQVPSANSLWVQVSSVVKTLVFGLAGRKTKVFTTDATYLTKQSVAKRDRRRLRIIKRRRSLFIVGYKVLFRALRTDLP